jgi:nuclear GTP-binding protein
MQSGKSSIINSILKRAALPIYSLSAFAANAATQGPSTTAYAFSETISSPLRVITLIDTPGHVLNASESAQFDSIRADDILLRNRGRIERLKDPLPPGMPTHNRWFNIKLMSLLSSG